MFCWQYYFYLHGAAASASHCSGWSIPPYVCREAGRGLVNTSTINSSYCEEDILTVYIFISKAPLKSNSARVMNTERHCEEACNAVT